jgi:two-component system KDP operon response regulator KdpE
MSQPETKGRALIIDDEPQIRRAVHNALAADFDQVFEAATGREGIDLAAAQRPALVILDLGLPDMPGVDVCLEIRRWSAAPIVVLSARHSEQEKVSLLDAGADDYVTKPFSPAEVRARVRAQVRRARMEPLPDQDGSIIAGDLVIDLPKRIVRRGGEYVHLTPTEWDLLRALVTRRGGTLTHQQIFRAVWGHAPGDAQAYLRVHVANLRRKIEKDPVRPALIITEPGVGYRFAS